MVVGRPPETDEAGNAIAKTHVTLLIPSKLRDFCKDNAKTMGSMSQIFTRVVTMLYIRQICPKCYDTKFIKTFVGVQCENCTTDYSKYWLEFYNCPNCDEPYGQKNMARGNKQCEKCCKDDPSKPIPTVLINEVE